MREDACRISKVSQSPGHISGKLLEAGDSIENIIKTASADYNTTEENASIAFWKFAKSLEAKGYIKFSEN